jgi:DMSO reductase anchor subunit
MSEIPYVIFTVFSQIAVGALIALLIADFLAKGKEDAKFLETGAWVPVPVAVIGMIAMLSHEARPLQAMMTMNANLATSWLSREVLALTGFVIVAVIYTVLWLFEPAYGSLKWFPVIPKLAEKFMVLRKPVGILGAVAGLGYLGVSARSYMALGMPAWNHASTALYFLVTSLLAGITAVAAMLSVKYLLKKEAGKPFTSFLWATVGIAVVMVVVLGVALYSNIRMVPLAGTEAARSAQDATREDILAGEHAPFLWLRVVIGIGLVLVCLAAFAVALVKNSIAKASFLVILVFACAFIGEVLGRIVFFGANVPLGEVIPYVLSSL